MALQVPVVLAEITNFLEIVEDHELLVPTLEVSDYLLENFSENYSSHHFRV